MSDNKEMPLILSILMFLLMSRSWGQTLPLHLLNLPPKFNIDRYAIVPDARSMALGNKGTVFVGTLSEGKVFAILPGQTPRKVITIGSGLTMPNGVAFYHGSLYVAEMHRILRYDNIEENLMHSPTPVIIRKDLPTETQHGWRYLRIGPDKKLYVTIGMPCNDCLREDKRLGTILRMNLDGSHEEIFAKGIRNSVGLAWDPKTKNLWFTENGRDGMGDDIPPDKLNVAPKPGLHFGFPYFDGKELRNPNYNLTSELITFPTLTLPAHVAALGMTFYEGNLFPDFYQNRLFIAEHGSWNRSKKIGYQVISVNVNGEKANDVQPFITGWLQGEKNWGRPVDIIMLPDGTLLVSDDFAGIIYQVSYKK